MILTLCTSSHGSTRTVVVLFAVANVKHNLFGTTFFEKYVKPLNIEHMSLTIITPHESHGNTLPLSAHKKRITHFVLTFTVKKKAYFESNASQIIHFPIQITLLLTFKTSEKETMFPSTPHPYFSSRFISTFTFLQVYQKSKPESNSCSVIIQIVTFHSVIFSPRYIGFIEVLATNNKPPQYKVNDLYSSMITIFHSYYPELSESIPPVRRYFLRRQINIEINNLQPSQLINCPLPSLPDSADTQQL